MKANVTIPLSCAACAVMLSWGCGGSAAEPPESTGGAGGGSASGGAGDAPPEGSGGSNQSAGGKATDPDPPPSATGEGGGANRASGGRGDVSGPPPATGGAPPATEAPATCKRACHAFASLDCAENGVEQGCIDDCSGSALPGDCRDLLQAIYACALEHAPDAVRCVEGGLRFVCGPCDAALRAYSSSCGTPLGCDF